MFNNILFKQYINKFNTSYKYGRQFLGHWYETSHLERHITSSWWQLSIKNKQRKNWQKSQDVAKKMGNVNINWSVSLIHFPFALLPYLPWSHLSVYILEWSAENTKRHCLVNICCVRSCSSVGLYLWSW